MAGSWANLPPELLGLCSQHLCLKDLSAFRAVCCSWRSAAVEDRSHVPWLMLSHKKGHEKGSKQWREFFCLSCQWVHKKPLHEGKARRCFSSRGWVLTVGKDWELHMLKNPASRHRHVIRLPNLKMFPDGRVKELRDLYHHIYGDYIDKFVLSDSPTASPDYKVMIVFEKSGRLGLWKPGDEEWTTIGGAGWFYHDVVFYKGCFLALSYDGTILRCDVNGPSLLEVREVLRIPVGLLGYERGYLVQSTRGSLLFVWRWVQHNHPTRTFRFDIFEIDLETQSWKEVETLKNTSLFLGWNSSFSLEADEEHHIKPNCIYFTDDFIGGSRLTEDGGGNDMGIYHLKDGSIEPHFKWKSYSHLSPPLWIEPDF